VFEQRPGDCKAVGLTARQSELGLADLGLIAPRLGEDRIMELGRAAGALQPNFEAAKTSYVIVFR
jgi:hypothetical protein